MNKHSERNTHSGGSKSTSSPQQTGSTNSSPTFSKPDTSQNAKEAKPEVVNKYTGKEPAKEAFTQVAAKDAAMPAPGAAKGDDDTMSQPQPKKSSMEELKSLWKQQITTAKTTWAKLTEDELQHIEGQSHKLIDLIQARYVITREEADKQVKRFFDTFTPAQTTVDEFKGNWKQQVGAAKIAWGKLTEDELMKTEGEKMRLAGLVQARYAIAREEADKQVKSFFEKNQG